MIHTRKLKPAEITAPQAKPANGYHPKLRSPTRGTLVGVRLQADLLALIEARCGPGQSRADVIRRVLQHEFTNS